MEHDHFVEQKAVLGHEDAAERVVAVTCQDVLPYRLDWQVLVMHQQETCCRHRLQILPYLDQGDVPEFSWKLKFELIMLEYPLAYTFSTTFF